VCNDDKTIKIYDYLMMSIYEKIRYGKSDYFIKTNEKNKNIEILNLIFGRYVLFVGIDEKISCRTVRYIRYGTNITDLRLINHIVIPIDELSDLKTEDGECIFNQIFSKYRKMYDDKTYENDERIVVIKNKLIDEALAVRRGKKKIYQTEEEKNNAKKECIKKWREANPDKISQYQSKYMEKSKILRKVKKISSAGTTIEIMSEKLKTSNI